MGIQQQATGKLANPPCELLWNELLTAQLKKETKNKEARLQGKSSILTGLFTFRSQYFNLKNRFFILFLSRLAPRFYYFFTEKRRTRMIERVKVIPKQD